MFLCLWILHKVFFCTLCRTFYDKKSKVTPWPIPTESGDELQNESDSDDEEYILSETEEEIIECETEEEIIGSETEEVIIESDRDNEQVNGNQIPSRARDNAEVKWGKRKWNVLNESTIIEEKLKLIENYEHFDNLIRFSLPMKYFKLFVNNELIDYIIFQSNLYATQLSQQNSTRAIKSFTKSEIKSTIWIILLMGIYKLNNRRMYWAPYSKVSIIADTMSRNRFEEILRHLHYNDNSLDLKQKQSKP